MPRAWRDVRSRGGLGSSVESCSALSHPYPRPMLVLRETWYDVTRVSGCSSWREPSLASVSSKSCRFRCLFVTSAKVRLSSLPSFSPPLTAFVFFLRTGC